jgi:hypothetical protein
LATAATVESVAPTSHPSRSIRTSTTPARSAAPSARGVSTPKTTVTSGAMTVEADGVALGVGDGVPPGALGVVEGEPLLDGDARFDGVSDG